MSLKKDVIELDKWFKTRVKNVCKPCWELNYCPYGPLVENYPAMPPTRKEAEEHHKFIVEKMKEEGFYKDEAQRKYIQLMIDDYDPNDYPIKITSKERDMFCEVFGHICPVFVVSEPFSETYQIRKVTRSIPRDVMLRVARRDNNTCQNCGRVLLDDEIEFDHIIPVAKGGSSTEANLLVSCRDCNRRKGKNVPFGWSLHDGE